MSNLEKYDTNYFIEYSESKNRHILIMFGFYPLIIVCVLLIISDYFIVESAHNIFSVFAISLVVIILIFGIIFTVPTYLVNRKDFKNIKINISGDEISFLDCKKNVSIKFSFDEIHKYTLIRYARSIYLAIQLDFLNGKVLSISNVMTNFDLLEKKLNSMRNLRGRLKFVAVGAHLKNVF